MTAHYNSILNQSKKKSHQRNDHRCLSYQIEHNDIIAALALYVRKVIRSEIQDASIFSILLDGTTDISHSEQVSFAIRFVHQMEIKERFIGLCHVDSTTGEEVEKLVMRVLN